MRLGSLALALAVVACSSRAQPPPPPKDDAATPIDAAIVEVSPRALGMPDLAAYAWRKRGGHPAFREARKAEQTGDWDAVVTTCRQALAADPGHLEAAWLLAVGLGKLGKLDAVLAPLQLAAAGDFGKWGLASLDRPALAAFLSTPLGEAWRRRVEQDRASYTSALARSLIVVAGGDLYAYDPETTRWYRLTRTFGAVIGALRVAPSKIAYVTRQRGKDKKLTLTIGLGDLGSGVTSHPVALATKGPILLVAAPDGNGVWIGAGPRQRMTWRRFDDDFKLTKLPPATKRPAGPRLEVENVTARLRALPVAGVSADWDEQGLASAIRIGKSNRVVSVPAPGLIDGNTATWSPSRSRLAFVAQLDERCTPETANAAVFVADATTGTVRELERGHDGLAIEWVGERKLAIAGDSGVAIVDLDGGAPVPLPGAQNLIVPRHRATCTPEETPAEPPTDGDEP
jgi:hypothetical protein